jgi:hypothetical protein
LAEHRPAALVTALTAWVNGDREHVPDGRGFMGRAWDAFVPPRRCGMSAFGCSARAGTSPCSPGPGRLT